MGVLRTSLPRHWLTTSPYLAVARQTRRAAQPTAQPRTGAVAHEGLRLEAMRAALSILSKALPRRTRPLRGRGAALLLRAVVAAASAAARMDNTGEKAAWINSCYTSYYR